MIDFQAIQCKMEENELKKYLQEIKNGEKTWEKDKDKNVLLVKSMLSYIGTTDSELRDHLIYSTFCQCVIDNLFDHQLLSGLLDYCLSESLLFKGIGEKDTDTVFTRSFSSLFIAVTLYKDNRDDFLPANVVSNAKDSLIKYINLENDLRGFVPMKGWAHSIAHVADAIDELVQSKKIEQNDYLEILTTLWNKMFTSNSVYIHGEDERILRPIRVMLDKGLEISEVERLITNIPSELQIRKEQITEENYWFLVANCKAFLKSLYIQVGSDIHLKDLRQNIELCLSEI
ncbi:DUF2785 domain-containing protein [Radiobacillus sp. PE A8.2]|uniref:DUF2785 domain-containing protein n=1 Tax=Radiobacillus sp. PE A8.2 TaxID=3380349 RepID=UPI00388FC1AD